MKYGKKMVFLLILVGLAGVAGLLVTGATDGAADSQAKPKPLNAYQPKQPIDYSHKLHAGELEIECQYCHTYARRSRSAGIPALEQCIACHMLIGRGKEPIEAINKSYESKEPIEWIKVHDLPDFVYFSHKPHVRAGFACQECHGQVQEMEVVHRQAPLTMGWCVNCHQANQEKGASLDCVVCHK